MNRPERAKREDAAEILALYRAAAKAANQSGYSHWDEDYPNRETIRDDLENGYLYVWREDGEIVAAITYMHPYDLDGLGISWTPVERAVEACRFCLSPSQQGKGRARAYFLGGMELLRAQGVDLFSNECVRLLGCRDAGHVFRTLVVFHVGNLRFNSIVFEENVCLGSPSFQKICPWANRFRRLSLPAAEAIDVFEDAQFDGLSAVFQAAFANERGQLVDGQAERMAHRVDDAASLGDGVQTRGIRRRSGFARRGVAVENCALGDGHPDRTRRPLPRSLNGAARAAVFWMGTRNPLGDFFREIERPEHGRAPLYICERGGQRLQDRAVAREEDLIAPPHLLSDLVHPVHTAILRRMFENPEK